MCTFSALYQAVEFNGFVRSVRKKGAVNRFKIGEICVMVLL